MPNVKCVPLRNVLEASRFHFLLKYERNSNKSHTTFYANLICYLSVLKKMMTVRFTAISQNEMKIAKKCHFLSITQT